MTNRRVALVGLAAIAAIAVLRAVVLFTPGVPSGIDGGNWLAFGTFVRPGMAYPPVVPAIFAALVAVAGAPLATVLAGMAATAAPAIAILAALTWARRPAAGAVAACAVVASRAIGEIAAWGGYPQPVATAAALAALVALAAYLGGPSRPALATFGAGIAVVAATSHLVAAPTVGAIVILLGWAAATHGRRAARRIAAAAAMAALPFALLGPTYGALIGALGGIAGGIRLDDAERVLGPGWPLYLAVLVLVPLGLAVASRRASIATALTPRDRVVVAAAAAAATSWIAAYAVSGEPRLLHDMAVLAPLGVAATVPLVRAAVRERQGRQALGAGALGAVALLVVTGLAAFPDQVAFYRVLTSDRFAAIEWLADHAPPQSRSILVADLGGVPVGWWTEGIARREVLFASNLRWLRFATERDRAVAANGLLYRSGFPGLGSAATIREAGVALVFLPSAGAFGVDPARPPSGWRVVFAAGDAIVLAPTS